MFFGYLIVECLKQFVSELRAMNILAFLNTFLKDNSRIEISPYKFFGRFLHYRNLNKFLTVYTYFRTYLISFLLYKIVLLKAETDLTETNHHK